MDLFRWFRSDKKPSDSRERPPKAVLRVFEKQREVMRGQQLTNEAISHGTLGNTAKALALVDQAISQHRYAPAMTVKARILINAGRPLQADRWLRTCLDRIDGSFLDGSPFPRESLRLEIYEQLGVVQFRMYGNFSEAIKYFQAALRIEPPSSAEHLRSTTYRELAHLYAIDGLPTEAIQFCHKRLATTPNCGDCKRILKLMHRLERRPQSFQSLVDTLVQELVSIGHPAARKIPSPLSTSVVYDSVVPIAFAWSCMQHKVKSYNFLSGAEVSLLAERAKLAMSGAYRAAADEVDSEFRSFAATLQLSGLNVVFGKDFATLSAEGDARLSSIMADIPIDDLFVFNERAIRCLARWAATHLKISPQQSIELIDSLKNFPPPA